MQREVMFLIYHLAGPVLGKQNREFWIGSGLSSSRCWRYNSFIVPWVHCRDWCWGWWSSVWAWFFTTRCLQLTAWLVSDVSDSAILLLWFLFRVGFVERSETILCAGALVWTFSQASDADEFSLIPYLTNYLLTGCDWKARHWQGQHGWCISGFSLGTVPGNKTFAAGQHCCSWGPNYQPQSSNPDSKPGQGPQTMATIVRIMRITLGYWAPDNEDDKLLTWHWLNLTRIYPL